MAGHLMMHTVRRRALCCAAVLLSYLAAPVTAKEGDPLDQAVAARQAYEEGQWDKARELYARLAKLLPDDADIRFRLGNVNARLGRLDEAADLYKEVLERQPAFPKAWHNLALVRLQQAMDSLAEAERRAGVEERKSSRRLLDALDNALGNPKPAAPDCPAVALPTTVPPAAALPAAAPPSATLPAAVPPSAAPSAPATSATAAPTTAAPAAVTPAADNSAGHAATTKLRATGSPTANNLIVFAAGHINLRTACGADNPRVAIVAAGSRLEVLDREGDCARVKTTKGKIGWLPQSLLRLVPLPSEKHEP
jgi:Flp pilus assembly protein TadD